MSSIHYFQRYSQHENVATNNTLLLLSRLYHHSPIKFKGFLNELLDDTGLEAEITFNQQTKGNGSVPDGSISQSSFKVIIETKSHTNFSIEQLKLHLNSFNKEEYKILLSLSPKPPNNDLQKQIFNEIKKAKTSIKYIPVTFRSIIEKFRNAIEHYDFQLMEIVDDYESYCINDGLIIDEDRMRAVTCGWTLEQNFKFDLYYDPAERGYSDHTYIGIYSDKAVIGIGKIENIITADLTKDGTLKILTCSKPVTKKQEQNIISVIPIAKETNDFDIDTGHKFFCVEKFYKTCFKKISKYPIQSSKFFNLKKVLEVSNLPDTQEIAKILKTKVWE